MDAVRERTCYARLKFLSSLVCLSCSVLFYPLLVGELFARPWVLEMFLRVIVLRVLDAVLSWSYKRKGKSSSEICTVVFWNFTGVWLRGRDFWSNLLTSRTCLNRLISPCTGQAAASPRAQMVWPSMPLEISSSMGISLMSASPTSKRSKMLSIHPVPSLNDYGQLQGKLVDDVQPIALDSLWSNYGSAVQLYSLCVIFKIVSSAGLLQSRQNHVRWWQYSGS